MKALAFIALLLATVLAQAAEPKPNDFGEVVRRGDLVQHVGGEDKMEGVDALYSQAMDGLPTDDKDKWFVYVVGTKGCAACVQLTDAWKTDPILRAYAKPENPKESWAHFHYYRHDDPKQAWRWNDPKNPNAIKITAFPTIVVQPPLSGKWGNPSSIVYQGVYEGDPKRLQQQVNGSIRFYLERLNQRQGGQISSVTAEAAVPLVENGFQQQQVPPMILPGEDPNPVSPPPREPRLPLRDPSIEAREEIVIVKDPEQVYGSGESEAIATVAEELQPTGLRRLRVREIDIEKAAKLYGVDPSEVPVVLRVEGQDVREKRAPKVDPNKEWGPLLSLWFGIGSLISIAFWCLGLVILLLFWVCVFLFIIWLLRKVGILAPKAGTQPAQVVVNQAPAPAPAQTSAASEYDAMILQRKKQLEYEELTARLQAARAANSAPAASVVA